MIMGTSNKQQKKTSQLEIEQINFLWFFFLLKKTWHAFIKMMFRHVSKGERFDEWMFEDVPVKCHFHSPQLDSQSKCHASTLKHETSLLISSYMDVRYEGSNVEGSRNDAD